MSPLKELAKLGRLTREFPGFLRTPLTPAEAADVLRQRLALRTERFLERMDRDVYANPRSPYRLLLGAAGCGPGDLRKLVATEGLEGALSHLARAGVYLAFDEFKGRREIVRGSLRLTVSEDDFDNPRVTPHLEARSGGTRGHGTSVKLELRYFRDQAVNMVLALQAHGLSDYAHVVWLQGFALGFPYVALGRPVLAWFHPIAPLPATYRLSAWYLTLLGGLLGRRVPPPRLLDVDHPVRLAEWLARRQAEGRRVCVTTYASSAVRVSVAAREKGIALDRTCFVTIGEPFTEAKRRALEAVRARALVRFGFTEAGSVGFGCRSPRGPDDVHSSDDSYGLIQHARTAGAPGIVVDAFLFTSLLPSAPKILLNVESGDYGTMETRACGCGLAQLGLSRHVMGIRSFEKLTGEGMTFVQTDLLRVLEEVLPARFGGTSADYQAIEEETELGTSRLLLIVSPAVGPVDDELVRRTFLDELARDATFDSYGAEMWRRAGTVEIRRGAPLSTRAGKILPFHLLRQAGPASGETP